MPAGSSPKTSASADRLVRALAAGFEPEPILTVSEWADANFQLTSKSSNEVGQYRTSRTSYVREILDALGPYNPVRQVTLMAGRQVAKTTILLVWLAYVIARCPKPFLLGRPTFDSAKRLSRERVGPMIEACEVLRGLVSEPRSRDTTNTVLTKEFVGGLLTMFGSNSAAAAKGSSAPYIALDELDEFAGDLNNQGDAIGLILESASTYPNRKVYLDSTPTLRDLSNIEKAFLRGTQERFYVPCPVCGHMDFIQWANIRMVEKQPETARLMCTACQQLIEERFKTQMLTCGQWRPTAESQDGSRSFHLPAFYSPLGWKSWATCAREFLEAQNDHLALKRWTNNVAAETWYEPGDAVEVHTLASRLEEHEQGTVPAGVGLLTLAVDRQKEYLDCLVVGWGAMEESWVIDHAQIVGDTLRDGPNEDGTPGVWELLDQLRATEYRHVSGRRVRPAVCVIDSGGFSPDPVYRYVRTRQARGVFAIKGSSLMGKELVAATSNRNSYRVRLFSICVDAGKQAVISRLRIPPPAPPGTPTAGYIHLPRWADAEFLEQLTSERKITRYRKGKAPTMEWVQTRARNEVLDLMCYNLAALYIYGTVTGMGTNLIRSLPERAAALSKPLEASEKVKKPEEGGSTPPPASRPAYPRPPRRGGWINNW